MDVNKFIGEKIRYFRNRKNITLEELSEYLKVTPQALSRYERGERKTDQDILFKLADYFKVSINDFFPPIDTNKVEQIANTNNKDNLINEVVRLFKEKGFIDEEGNVKEETKDIIDMAVKLKDMSDKKKED